MHYILSRLFAAVIVIFGVITLVFFLIHLIPGDPAEFMLGEYAKPADLQAMRESMGLDKPILIQYWHYLKSVLSLEFGESLLYKKPVMEIIAFRLPASIELAIASLLVALLLALPLGVIAAVKKDSWLDRTAMTFSLLGVSIPNFWLGPLLILIFSISLDLLPVSGRQGWSSLILPAVTLGTAFAAILSRMIRSSLLEVLAEDYIRTAYAKGLGKFKVVVKHGLRNALLPVITLLGIQLGALLGGAVITETVFDWPGIGKLTVDAIMSRDYPMVQACILLISLFYVMVNILTDLLYVYIDPRIRVASRI